MTKPVFHGAVTLTAVRRPDLLARTLASFAEALRQGFPVGPVFVNLDPVMGDARAQTECRDVVRAHFPEAKIFEPETASFGAAVIRLWTHVPDGPVLHLEDDWTCLHEIDLDAARHFLEGKTTMVCFRNNHHGRKGERVYSETRHRYPVLWGLMHRKRRVPLFNTGPALADGSFLRACALRMDATLDPEKQMRRPMNSELNDWLERYRCRFLKAPDGGLLLTDDGREWRAARGLDKHVADGRSVWSSR